MFDIMSPPLESREYKNSMRKKKEDIYFYRIRN